MHPCNAKCGSLVGMLLISLLPSLLAWAPASVQLASSSRSVRYSSHDAALVRTTAAYVPLFPMPRAVRRLPVLQDSRKSLYGGLRWTPSTQHGAWRRDAQSSLAAVAREGTFKKEGVLPAALTAALRMLTFQTVILMTRVIFETVDIFLRMARAVARIPAALFTVWAPTIRHPTFKKGCKCGTRPRVLIIGGSFAGLACARNLRNDFDVTLIDRKDFFEYTPGVLRLLVHPERFPALTAPLAKLRGVSFVHGAAEEVLPGEVSVRRHGAVESETLPFDFLVLGCGSSYCMDGIKASYGDIDDVQRQLSWNQQAARVQAARSILVVGGGPVGVELAAEIKEERPGVHVTIVESKKDLCLNFAKEKTRKHLRRWLREHDIEVMTGSRCSLVTQHGGGALTVAVSRASKSPPAEANLTSSAAGLPQARPRSSELLLRADVVYWCGGGSSDTKRLQLKLGEIRSDSTARRGPTAGIVVKPTMQVVGIEKVFALGDVAFFTEGIQDVKLGHAAEVQSRTVCANIRHLEKGKGELMRHVASDDHKIYCLSMGKYDGSMRMGPIVINGVVAAILKWVVEWTKVAQARDRPIGTAFWQFSDFMTWRTIDGPGAQ